MKKYKKRYKRRWLNRKSGRANIEWEVDQWTTSLTISDCYRSIDLAFELMPAGDEFTVRSEGHRTARIKQCVGQLAVTVDKVNLMIEELAAFRDAMIEHADTTKARLSVAKVVPETSPVD